MVSRDRDHTVVPRVIIEDVESPTNEATSPITFIGKGFHSFPGKVPTFLDSGASDNMFVLKDDFVKYKTTALRTGDSVKAVDGNFEIVGKGQVVQCYSVEGREKKSTYTHALHTPTLSANLISVSAFDNAGLTTTFGCGQGTITKGDGTVVLTARQHKGMYVIDVLDNIPETSNTPIAMSSLSQSTSLEQWHRRLTHCSPSTIQEMANN